MNEHSKKIFYKIISLLILWTNNFPITLITKSAVKNMMKYKIIAIIIISTVILSGFISDEPEGITYYLAGTIVSEKTGKPVKNVLVAVTPGEEEALTNAQGEFKIETIKKTPFILTAEHLNYEKLRMGINDVNKKLVIRLRPKEN